MFFDEPILTEVFGCPCSKPAILHNYEHSGTLHVMSGISISRRRSSTSFLIHTRDHWHNDSSLSRIKHHDLSPNLQGCSQKLRSNSDHGDEIYPGLQDSRHRDLGSKAYPSQSYNPPSRDTPTNNRIHSDRCSTSRHHRWYSSQQPAGDKRFPTLLFQVELIRQETS